MSAPGAPAAAAAPPRLPPPPPPPAARLPPPPPPPKPDALFQDPAQRRRFGRPPDGRRPPAGALQFVAPGSVAAAAEAARASAAAAEAAGATAAAPEPSRTAAAAAAAGALPLLPRVEWWDARLLKEPTAYGGAPGADAFAPSNLNAGAITALVDHPPPLAPAVAPAAPPPAPLRLTAKERKKMRTQRRAEKQAEKRDLVRQGLVAPEGPKVKLSNLARVLGAAAAADPTAVEREVRRQTAERHAAHEDRNLAAALAPAEKRAKKIAKAEAAAAPPPGGALRADLYAITGPALCASNKLKFKVRANADELRLAGFAAAAPARAAILVVGGPAPLKKFARLVTARIDWAAPDGVAGAPEGDDFVPSTCARVWSGALAAPPSGPAFLFAAHPDDATARAVLERRGCASYWDVAATAGGGGGADGGGE